MAMTSPTPTNNNGEQEPSAIARVFGITELVEAILSEMDPRDLLLSQRVCKLFREIFQQSTAFKQRLHLLPSDDGEFSEMPVVPTFTGRFHEKDLAYLESSPPDLAQYWSLNDLPAVHRPEESWRQMQLTSPPTETVNLCYIEWYPGWSQLVRAYDDTLTNSNGVTLGELVDIIEDLLKLSDGSSRDMVEVNLGEIEDKDN